MSEGYSKVAIWVESGRQAGRVEVIIRWVDDAQTADCSISESVRAGITSFAARLNEWIWGGVVVVMGDSRRHKDISYAAQRGLVDYRCFLTELEKEARSVDGYYSR